MRRAFERIQMFTVAGELKVAPRLFAVPDAFPPLRMVPVVVVLVNGSHSERCIYDGRTHGTCLPNKPVVPVESPDGQRSDFAEEPLRKHKIVDFESAPHTLHARPQAKLLFPRRVGECKSLYDIGVP